MPVAADLQPLLDAMAEARNTPISEASPEDRRALFDEMFGPGGAEMGSVTDRVIPGGDGDDLPVRVYRPTGVASGGPVVVFFHGGGWVIGNLDTHDEICRAIAATSDVVVVSVDYRLAPEHPFPAAVDDGYAAVCWVAEHAEDLDVDAGRLIVAGDSAGGNLSAVVSMLARDRGAPEVAFQFLIYPATDFDYETGRWPSLEENATGLFLELDTMRWFRGHLSGGADLGGDPRAAPIRAASHEGLAPAHIMVAGFDPLRDEGLGYAAVLNSAGVATTTTLHPEQVHGYWNLAALVPSCGAAREADLASLRATIAALSAG